MLVFGEPDQPAADQRTSLEVEGGTGFQFGNTIKFCLGVIVRTKIVLDQQKTAAFHRGDPLHRLTVDRDEGSAQRLMPSQDAVQRPAKSRVIEITLQTQAKRDMIGLAGALHLRQKPQPLLRKRKQQSTASFTRRDGRHYGEFSFKTQGSG